MAAPTVLGVIDTYGIELIHPMREGRSPQQIGRKGLSNHRWIVGGKLCLLLNQWGLVVGWACATANVADNTFQWLIRQFEEQMIVLSDTGFHAAEGDPANLKLCQRGEWEDRMLVETVLSMLALVCHFKKVMHRVWTYFHARLAFTAPSSPAPEPEGKLAEQRGHGDALVSLWLLLDSRVVDVPMAYNPTFVTLSSLKPFFFNGLQNE
jgi:hypothetical protein